MRYIPSAYDVVKFLMITRENAGTINKRVSMLMEHPNLVFNFSHKSSFTKTLAFTTEFDVRAFFTLQVGLCDS